LHAWSRFVPTRPERSVLILRRAEGSTVAGWMPSASAAVVALSAVQILEFISFLEKWHVTVRPELDAIGFEMPLAPPDLDKIITGFMRSGFEPPSLFSLYIYPEMPQAAALKPFVIAPKSVDELFPMAPPG
jgi:hypothetical protein